MNDGSRGASSQSGAPTVTYISWAESCSRSDHTARELGGRSHMVYLPSLGSRPSTILFKYIGQWWRTAGLLRRERPDAVFVMSPPVVAALPAFWYAWRRGKHLVLDVHTAAFLHPRWRRFQGLQGALCRWASTTIVHNEHLAARVRNMGAHATVVPDVPIVYEEVERFQKPDDFTVAVVCSFNYDEPVAAILAAARLLPEVRFFMTGNPKHLAPDLAERLPDNVTLTGFISVPAYGGLLTGADVVMSLTNRDHTMLRGAYEAIYQGTPVVVSDWPLLREFFDTGAAHADNTAQGIADAIRLVKADLRRFRDGATALRDRKRRQWESTRQGILARLDGPRKDTHVETVGLKGIL